eukprot:2917572-Pyramimonas_sp.AAC.1
MKSFSGPGLSTLTAAMTPLSLSSRQLPRGPEPARGIPRSRGDSVPGSRNGTPGLRDLTPAATEQPQWRTRTLRTDA